MKENTIESAGQRIRQLLSFLFWYAVGVAGMVYLLPMAGLLLENGYDELGRAARLLTVIGFVVAVAAWQLFSAPDRRRRSSADKQKA